MNTELRKSQITNYLKELVKFAYLLTDITVKEVLELLYFQKNNMLYFAETCKKLVIVLKLANYVMKHV